MNLNIITKAIINITRVEELLKDAVEGQTGMKVKHIKFKGTTSYNYRDYRDEPGSPVFTGIEVEFELPTRP